MNGRDVEFFVTHVGLYKPEKENAIKTLLPFIRITDNPVVVMGDFNMTSDNPIMKPLLDELQDSFDYYPDQTVFTWPCKPEMFPQYAPSSYERIDYILLSRHFKIESVEIPNLILSDHKPYIANVELLDDVKG
jgi:endonuclease/exonuclease/phosphatase family metal-dependent hydrolase